jgi:hypothetical protein
MFKLTSVKKAYDELCSTIHGQLILVLAVIVVNLLITFSAIYVINTIKYMIL